MPDSPRTAARDLCKQAAEAGVAPMLLGASPWAVRKDLLPRLAQAVRMPALSGFTSAAAAPTSQPITAGVAVIPLTGIITPQGSFFDFFFGGGMGGLLGFRERFMEAVNDPDVSAIVIDVDSPGGLVDLVPETAALIRAARGPKPIVAIADTLMASAAYWLASQADEIAITPSGYAGSVGVYRVHEDWSRFDEEFGVAVSYVHAGKYKVEGNAHSPLDDEAREQWQSDVDDHYASFVADVAAGRGVSEETVLADYGEGRCLNAQRALDAGLVDRIATYDDVIAGLLGRAAEGETPAMAVQRLAAELVAAIGGPSADAPDAKAIAEQLAAALVPPATDDSDDESAAPAPAPEFGAEERAYRALLELAR